MMFIFGMRREMLTTFPFASVLPLNEHAIATTFTYRVQACAAISPDDDALLLTSIYRAPIFLNVGFD